MKKILKKILPDILLRWYRNYAISGFKSMNTKEVFTEIYNNNHWKSRESISGVGSGTEQTQSITNALSLLINDMSIKSVLDIPCGDFKWMKKVDLTGVRYTGADIVDALVSNNSEHYGIIPDREFIVLDLIRDQLPEDDLLIVRDCLVHLSFYDAIAAIQNIRSSGCRYLLATTFPECRINYDITTGGWRRLNLRKEPFCFPDPILEINENCTEEDGSYRDKSMALWEISKL